MKIETLMKEREYLDSVIKNATNYLKDAPEGYIIVKHSEGKYWKFFQKLYSSSKYLSLKTNKALIKTLAQKSYARKALKLALEQKAIIEDFLALYNPNAFSDLKEKCNRIADFITPYKDFFEQSPVVTNIKLETNSDIDLAKNLLVICNSFLQSKNC